MVGRSPQIQECRVLFITPSKSAKHAKDYYTAHMERSDYYMKDSPEIAGQWNGLGAELLGLSGTVDKERYFALCDNINPATGEKLTPHTKGNRRVLYDFTFDAPKSVTLASEVCGDTRIVDEFRAAIKDTMSDMEASMMTRVRSNKRDEDRVTANMVWAEFIHKTTRPLDDGIPDPQLHAHIAVFNQTFDTEENKWKAAQFGNIVRDKGDYQAAFHTRLAGRLERLGYGIERDGKSFRLAGIAPETVKKFSRRTEEIEAEAARLGITNAKAKGELGARTRNSKDPEGMGLPELRKLWLKRLSDAERDAIVRARHGQETSTLGATAAMDYALAHCFVRQSAVTEKELLTTAMIHSVGSAGVNEIREQLLRPNIIRRVKNGIRYVTTQQVWQQEEDMKNFVRDGRGQFAKLGGFDPPLIDAALGKEHREAGWMILNSRDRVTALKGGAGTGKTTLIKAVGKEINKAGKEVFTFATSTDAVGVLQEEGFTNANTVARLLKDRDMQAKMKNQVIWLDEGGLPSVTDMKGVFDIAQEQNARVVISGDTSQHHGVERGDALRILERDGAMKTATLKQIRRQTDANYRAAVKAISEGDIPGKDGRTRLQAGLEMLDRAGVIIEAPGENRYQRIAEDYAEVAAARKHGGGFKTALVVSPTHREGEKVTKAIREELKRDGRLGGSEREFLSLRPLNLTDAQKSDKAEYSPGSIVQFTQNAKGFGRGERLTVTAKDKDGVHAIRADGSDAVLPLNQADRFQLFRAERVAMAKGDKLRITMNGFVERETRRGVLGARQKDRLNNGSLYEVEGFTKKGDIRLAGGVVLPKDYGGVTHGYVVTSHSSQGKTVDVSLIALGHESFAAANREQLYVSVSRGREAVRLYTDDKRAMMEAVQGSAARMSASELMQPERAKPKPSFMQRMIRRGVVQRAYTAVRERMTAYAQEFQQRRQRQEGLSLG
jgi:conjugative relaxase-like TrwC/TraI family protein